LQNSFFISAADVEQKFTDIKLPHETSYIFYKLVVDTNNILFTVL